MLTMLKFKYTHNFHTKDNDCVNDLLQKVQNCPSKLPKDPTVSNLKDHKL